MNSSIGNVHDTTIISGPNKKDGSDAVLQAKGPELSVVVPCYNEEETIDELHRRVMAIFQRRNDGSQSELVLVDDGSTDSTWRHILAMVGKDPRIVGVKLSRNHGHQKALSAGLALCRGKRILILDADLQDPPELLPKMMKLMDEGADIVYGKRGKREGESWFKLVSAALFYRIIGSLSEVQIPTDTGDFRLINRRVLDLLNTMPEQHRFIRGMLSWVGFKQIPLIYNREKRYAGQTKYPFRKMVQFALDAITGFSIVPLRLATYFGFLIGVFGLVFLAYTLYLWFVDAVVQGWTSLVTVVLVLGSVQLFVMGILGEYLGRLYMEAKGRPLFVIDEVARNVTQGSREIGK